MRLEKGAQHGGGERAARMQREEEHRAPGIGADPLVDGGERRLRGGMHRPMRDLPARLGRLPLARAARPVLGPRRLLAVAVEGEEARVCGKGGEGAGEVALPGADGLPNLCTRCCSRGTFEYGSGPSCACHYVKINIKFIFLMPALIPLTLLLTTHVQIVLRQAAATSTAPTFPPKHSSLPTGNPPSPSFSIDLIRRYSPATHLFFATRLDALSTAGHILNTHFDGKHSLYVFVV